MISERGEEVQGGLPYRLRYCTRPNGAKIEANDADRWPWSAGGEFIAGMFEDMK